MASIPIMAAVAAAIIVPVAGTGIYYSVRPATHKEETNEEPIRRLKDPRLHDHGRVIGDSMPGSRLLNVGSIEQRLESMKESEERSEKEKNEAKEITEKLLRGKEPLDLNSVFPSTFNNTRTESWASSHSSSSLRRP